MSGEDDKKDGLSRRNFLAIGASVAAGGLVTSCGNRADINAVTAPTPEQKAGKRTGDSSLGIARCSSYEEDVFGLLKPLLKDLNLPKLNGKVVMIKPNMIDFYPGKPVTTAVQIIEASVKLADYLGAKDIVVGEGPGHKRDTDYLLAATGHGALYKRLGLKYVDLNVDDLVKVANPHGFTKLDHFYLPKTAVEADYIISVPKMKTHHWARITCSMKNLYGAVPGRRYGWPKNVLHYRGIDNSILDLTRLLKPEIQVVDAVVAMEGDGPLNGTPKNTNFVMVGNDPAATDSTCARIMGILPANVPYLSVAGEVIGNIDPTHIKVFGADVASVSTQFQPAPLFDPSGKRIKTGDANSSSS